MGKKKTTYGVFGLGISGQAAIRFLHGQGKQVFAWDDKGKPDDAPILEGVAYLPFEAWPWEEMDRLVLSPGVPLTHPKPHAVVEHARAAGCVITGDVSLFMQANPQARYVAISGTNGKSTTASLLFHLLQEAGIPSQLGGNIGVPACALAPPAEAEVVVLELSSYQLDLLGKERFDMSMLLNITPDHLDRHGDMEGYCRAKSRLFSYQTPGDVAIVATDDEYTRAIAAEVEQGDAALVRVSGYGAEKVDVVVKEGEVLVQHPAMAEGAYPFAPSAALAGVHARQNVAAAWVAGALLGVAPEVMQKGVASFEGLPHRMQHVARVGGVTFVNDSKATNAEAARYALQSFEDIYWIAGGRAKAEGALPLLPYLQHVRHVALIGEAANAFAQVLEPHVDTECCVDLDAALALSVEKARQGQAAGQKPVVLLSPACASFDQFPNFAARGEAFCTWVQQYASQTKDGSR